MRPLAAAIVIASLALALPASAWVAAYGTRRPENNFADFVGPAIAVDGSGDAYVRSVDNPPDFLVVRLDGATGRRRWRSDLGPGAAFAIALDQADDVVAGGSCAAGNVVKLDGTTGATKWGAVSLSPSDVAIDPAGDVLAAGNLSGFAFDVAKLDGATGAAQWQYPLGMFGQARSVVADAAGNVIAGGHFDNGPTGTDAVVVKLAGGTGAEVWRYTVAVDPTTGNFDTVAKVALDGSGDVIVGGWGQIGALKTGSFLLAKVSGTDGSEIWRLPNGTDGFGAFVLDGAGDVYDVEGFPPEVVKRAGSDGSEL